MDDIPLSRFLLMSGDPAYPVPHRVSRPIWLLDHPDLLLERLTAQLDAGARLLCAPTGGADRVRLRRTDRLDDLTAINSRLVDLTRQVAGTRAKVAGCLAPLGFPPMAEYDPARFEALIGIYAQQARILEAAGADVIFLEGASLLADFRAALLGVRESTSLPFFVTASCTDAGRTAAGTDVLGALLVMQGMGADAFGLDDGDGPADMARQMGRLAPYARLPLIARPDEGPREDEDGNPLPPFTAADLLDRLPELAGAGVRLFGGRRGVGAETIAAMGQALARLDLTTLPRFPEPDPDLLPCACELDACFITPTEDPGEPLSCSPTFAEDILAREDSATAIKVTLRDEDDVALFLANQYMIRDALCLSAPAPELLEQALRGYHGRAFYDSSDELESEQLEPLAKKYGLVIL